MEKYAGLDKPAGSDIIKENMNNGSNTMVQVTKLGRLNSSLFEEEFGALKTDDIIVTDERIEHIKLHHPDDYALFEKFASTTVQTPDVVIKDTKHENTVFLIKTLKETNLNVVARLVLSEESENIKNSVMTFYRIRDKNLKKLEKKHKVLYKKE